MQNDHFDKMIRVYLIHVQLFDLIVYYLREQLDEMNQYDKQVRIFYYNNDY